MDAIKSAVISKVDSIDVSESQLKEVLGAGYGIFSGKDVQWAVLHFTPERARWVASERWHSKQQGKFLSDGTYELRIPFSDSRELVMDILKHGPDVKVLEPVELVVKIKEFLKKTIDIY